jgi:hypothetical protein
MNHFFVIATFFYCLFVAFGTSPRVINAAVPAPLFVVYDDFNLYTSDQARSCVRCVGHPSSCACHSAPDPSGGGIMKHTSQDEVNWTCQWIYY